MTKGLKLLRVTLACATALGGVTMLPAPVIAQTVTGAIGGTVNGADNAPAAGATVVAVSSATNQTRQTVTGANGRYTLNGLRPGQYNVTVTGTNGATFNQVVIVAIGQSATLNAVLVAAPAAGEAPPAEAAAGDIVVTGNRLVETKTSEVATNISRQQIESLPQTDRNFLSFAALAPGVRYVDSESNKGIQSGASTRSQVNVFIDGVSLKNQVLDGGIAGQQDSRGNPFGQLAVQEFRVITQNYKAEYEQAGAAIITAVTKSGTNEFHGEAFGQYTGKEFAEKDFFAKHNDSPEPKFNRKQYGLSLGGPIIKDKLFFFGAYEGNDQDRAQTVIIGNRTPENIAQFGQYEGQFVSPFRGDFYFGKLTFTPDSDQTFDLSFSRRSETDIQGFGGQTAFTAAENKHNVVDTYNYKWTYNGADFINEFEASYLNYQYNPTSLNPEDPTYIYDGVITFGGKDSSQDIFQQSYVLRDDLTLNKWDNHVVKLGVKFSFQDYEFNKLLFTAPEYLFKNDPANNLDFSFPAQAQLGIGNPRFTTSDSQLGVYLQDDWDVTNKLQLNLGLRWDYESNEFNNKYRTSAAAAAVLSELPTTDYFDGQDYISTGNNRDPFLGAFQPRVGFSYDLNDDQRTVIFGGYGRYYDRSVFNNTLDELFRTRYQTGTFYFSRDGLPREGHPTVIFDPKYLTREGLLELQQQATTGLPELFAVPNNAKPPVTDQFSLGIRQKVGIFRASVTGSYIRGRNGYTNLFASRNPDGSCCDNTIPISHGYADALIGYSGLDTRYYGLYVTIDKDYTEASGWGVNLAYTLSKAQGNGGDLFSLDHPTPDDYGYRPITGDERHRIVLSGIVDLPLGFQFSTLTTLGSGQAFQFTDARQGGDVNHIETSALYPPKNCIGIFAYCEVNLTLEKKLKLFNTHELTVGVDLFNAFNNKNFTGYGSYVGQYTPAGTTTPVAQTYAFDNSLSQQSTDQNVFLQPSSLFTLPRRIQFRVSYKF